MGDSSGAVCPPGRRMRFSQALGSHSGAALVANPTVGRAIRARHVGVPFPSVGRAASALQGRVVVIHLPGSLSPSPSGVARGGPGPRCPQLSCRFVPVGTSGPRDVCSGGHLGLPGKARADPGQGHIPRGSKTSILEVGPPFWRREASRIEDVKPPEGRSSLHLGGL